MIEQLTKHQCIDRLFEYEKFFDEKIIEHGKLQGVLEPCYFNEVADGLISLYSSLTKPLFDRIKFLDREDKKDVEIDERITSIEQKQYRVNKLSDFCTDWLSTPGHRVPWSMDFWGNFTRVLAAIILAFVPLWLRKFLSLRWLIRRKPPTADAPKRADAESAEDNSRNAVPLRDDSASRNNDLSIDAPRPRRYRTSTKSPVRVDLEEDVCGVEVGNG